MFLDNKTLMNDFNDAIMFKVQFLTQNSLGVLVK